MFILNKQFPLKLDEILANYNLDACLGFLAKNGETVKTGEISVALAKENRYDGAPEVYISYNPLKKNTHRNKKNVGRLAMLYVDLDIGRGENSYEDDTTQEYKQKIVSLLEKNEFGKTIPAPNYICDSGRGLYLLYVIHQSTRGNKQEHANAAGRWERINSWLTEQLKEYCADISVCTDEARVLRIPGSINSNNGAEVRYYRYSDIVYTLHKIEYEFMNEPSTKQLEKLERMEAVLGIMCSVRNKRCIRIFMERNEAAYLEACRNKPATKKQLSYAQDIATRLDIILPQIQTAGEADDFIKVHKSANDEAKKKKYRSNAEWLEKRLKRLEKVIIDAPKDSYREIALFYYRLFACQYVCDKKIAATMTKKIIGEMRNPLPESSVMRSTKTAEKYWEKGVAYKISDETLAARFDMSLAEWGALLPEEICEKMKERKREYNQQYYARKLEKRGETTKKNKIAERREEMACLLSMGKTKEEICAELGISERTLYYDMQNIKDQVQDSHELEIQDATNEITAKISTSRSNRGHKCPRGSFRVFPFPFPPLLAVSVCSRLFADRSLSDSS